jgi:hypothetical protein
MRRLRSAAAIEVCVRCDDNELQPVRYPDRDHVAFEQLANSDPGVKPAANDVRYRVISRDLEIYLGILRLKTRDDRSYNQIDRWRRRGDPQLPARLVTERAGAVITTVDQIISELALDWTSPNGQKLVAILDYR